MKLFHFSDNSNIEVFHPRPPLAHPETEPLVFAIDEWHQPIYFFPRDCPRIGVWPVPTTSREDLAWFKGQGDQRMLFFVDPTWQQRHAQAELWRYEFSAEGFEDCHDHGCWASRVSQTPTQKTLIQRLPDQILESGCQLVVKDLVQTANQLYPATTLHISMIRMRNLEGWEGRKGQPVKPQS